jgi:hypothetical protein
MGRFLRVEWHHDFSDEPVWLYSELDGERYEVRKVEVYRDGRRSFADSDRSVGGSVLGEIPTPTMDEFSDLDEFTAVEIDESQFDAEWVAALSSREGGAS